MAPRVKGFYRHYKTSPHHVTMIELDQMDQIIKTISGKFAGFTGDMLSNLYPTFAEFREHFENGNIHPPDDVLERMDTLTGPVNFYDHAENHSLDDISGLTDDDGNVLPAFIDESIQNIIGSEYKNTLLTSLVFTIAAEVLTLVATTESPLVVSVQNEIAPSGHPINRLAAFTSNVTLSIPVSPAQKYFVGINAAGATALFETRAAVTSDYTAIAVMYRSETEPTHIAKVVPLYNMPHAIEWFALTVDTMYEFDVGIPVDELVVDVYVNTSPTDNHKRKAIPLTYGEGHASYGIGVEHCSDNTIKLYTGKTYIHDTTNFSRATQYPCRIGVNNPGYCKILLSRKGVL